MRKAVVGGRWSVVGSIILAASASFCAAAETPAPSAPDPKMIEAFRAACAEKSDAAAKANSIAVAGSDGWWFLTGELRHLSVGKFWGDEAAKVSHASNPEWADPVPAILDFKQQLDKLGIQLILMPVPCKAIVYPDMLTDAIPHRKPGETVPQLDVQHQEFYKLLREKGITVLDLTDELLKERRDKNTPLYCKSDTHWSPYACEQAAILVKKQLGKQSWLPATGSVAPAGGVPALPAAPFTLEFKTLEIIGDLEKAARADAAGKESLIARIVTPKPGGPAETTDRASPVLLLGDSHCLVFHAGGDMHATGAGLVDQLAAELGIPIDLLGVRGSGATPARISLMQRARPDEKYLAGKKLIIWCFTAREFTESQGWRKVPVVK